MADRRTDFVASAGAPPSPLEEVPMFLPSPGEQRRGRGSAPESPLTPARSDASPSDPTRSGQPGGSVPGAPRPPVTVREQRRRVDWTSTVDWSQVVSLRKAASEVITGESQAYLTENGRPMPAEDRLLMGRSVIRRVVNDHVRALHRDGAALWSPETERTYAQAVEDSVFGYGRMQPLFEIEDAENIEIHGWNRRIRAWHKRYGSGSTPDCPSPQKNRCRSIGNSRPAAPTPKGRVTR